MDRTGGVLTGSLRSHGAAGPDGEFVGCSGGRVDPAEGEQTAERLLREGLTNAEVLEGIREAHGEDASMDSVARHRSRLRKVEPAVMTDREARLDGL
jgi:hypothetical protein